MWRYNLGKGGLTSPPFFVWIFITFVIMAVLGKGILDGFKGKLDGLVGQKRNGHSTISQHRDGADINWSLQTDHERTRMSALCTIYGFMDKAFFNQMFCEGPKTMNAQFRMIKANYKHCDGLNITFGDDMIKYHSILQPLTNTVWGLWTTPGIITYSSRNSVLRRGESLTDVYYFLYYLPAEKLWFTRVGPVTRATQNYSFAVPARPNGTVYYQAFFFVSADGKRVSQVKSRVGVRPN